METTKSEQTPKENSAHSFTEGADVPESVPSCGAKSVIEERLLNAFYKALQWDGGEITGIDMKTLEQRVHGILTKH